MTRAALLACAVGVATAAGGAACAPVDQEWVDVRWLDYPRFVSDVEPVLEDRCANPTCHGRPDRPLSIYAPLEWRADPSRTFLPEALSEEELMHNYRVACATATDGDRPAHVMLVLKPLGASGGTYHGGGVVFEASEPEYRAMLAWVAEGW